MKVAFATNDGRTINAHFGQCAAFAVYELYEDHYEHCAIRKMPTADEADEWGKIESRVRALKDCTIVFLTQIGPSAAAQITRSKVMPVKVAEGTPIGGEMNRLLELVQTHPPVWLKKAMAVRPETGERNGEQ